MSDVDRIREQLQISCADALELMTDHMEGALSPADAARFRDHLSGCEPCSVFLDQLRATIVIAGEGAPDEEYAIGPDSVETLVAVFRREHHT
jgi:predicted anti-sigma-YlaC factor YlaD